MNDYDSAWADTTFDDDFDRPDIGILAEANLVLLRPLTTRGGWWLDRNLQRDGMRGLDGISHVVEQRYLLDILTAALNAGLSTKGITR